MKFFWRGGTNWLDFDGNPDPESLDHGIFLKDSLVTIAIPINSQE